MKFHEISFHLKFHSRQTAHPFTFTAYATDTGLSIHTMGRVLRQLGVWDWTERRTKLRHAKAEAVMRIQSTSISPASAADLRSSTHELYGAVGPEL